MIETKRYEWERLSAQGSAATVPRALVELVNAKNEDEADSAYWRIDNTVAVQGALFDAALPTMRVLVSGIYGCTDASRPRVLELMVQLASGSNVAVGSSEHLVSACRSELTLAAGYFLFLLEHGATEEREHCVDLLGLCALADTRLLSRVRWYLESARDDQCPADLQRLIDATLTELQGLEVSTTRK